MTKISILFDVDGVLTLPITSERQISIPDVELFLLLEKLYLNGIKFSLITGRAFPWVKKFILPVLKCEIPIYLEYGLVSYHNNNITILNDGEDFKNKYHASILNNIRNHSNKKQLIFDLTKYIDYPDHGSLWIEDKISMISIAANKNISVSQCHSIVEKAIEPLKSEINFFKHHLGCDILPLGWTKEMAAKHAQEIIDPKNNTDLWLVFGDNESDREMCKPLANVIFIDTKNGASEKTKQELKHYFADILV